MSNLHNVDLLLRRVLIPQDYGFEINDYERKCALELRRQVSNVNIEYKNGSVHPQWVENLRSIKEQILMTDPRNFLQWDLIRRTMFVGNAIFVFWEFLYLLTHNWNKWKKIVLEGGLFKYEPYILFPKSSGNLIHYAYHIAKFEAETMRKIRDFNYVFEFGGGYGGLCQLIYKTGFKGRYVIFDFSVLSALQIYYLRMNRTEVRSAIDKRSHIFCLHDVNLAKRSVPKNGKKLFVATWSLSESPVDIRKKFLPVLKKMDAFLIGFQDYFSGVDNIKYFENFRKQLSGFKWSFGEIAHLRRNYYLFGYKDGNV